MSVYSCRKKLWCLTGAAKQKIAGSNLGSKRPLVVKAVD